MTRYMLDGRIPPTIWDMRKEYPLADSIERFHSCNAWLVTRKPRYASSDTVERIVKFVSYWTPMGEAFIPTYDSGTLTINVDIDALTYSSTTSRQVKRWFVETVFHWYYYTHKYDYNDAYALAYDAVGAWHDGLKVLDKYNDPRHVQVHCKPNGYIDYDIISQGA